MDKRDIKCMSHTKNILYNENERCDYPILNDLDYLVSEYCKTCSRYKIGKAYKAE